MKQPEVYINYADVYDRAVQLAKEELLFRVRKTIENVSTEEVASGRFYTKNPKDVEDYKADILRVLKVIEDDVKG